MRLRTVMFSGDESRHDGRGKQIMLKKYCAVLLLFILLTNMTAFAEEQKEGTADGITVELIDMRFEWSGKDLRVTPEVLFQNETGKDIMKVRYMMIFFDAEGNELGSEGMFFAVDEPLPDGGEAVQDDCRFPLKYTEVPDHAEIRVLEYKTAEDIPPIHVPKEGEYLYKALNCGNLNALPDLLPKRITVHVDRMGYEQKAVFEAGNGLEEAVDAFMRIRVGEDDAPSVTDNYNWFLFEWEDDTSYMIRLSQYSLEYKTNACFHIFYLLDSEEFWAMAFDSLR